MNKHDSTDETLLTQIDGIVARGTASNTPVLNDLINTVPQADAAFQQHLEERLAAHARLQEQARPEQKVIDMQSTPILRQPAKARSSVWLRAAAVLVLALAGGYLLQLYRQNEPEPAIPLPMNGLPQTLIIATQNIHYGETVTEEMVGFITLSAEDAAKLQQSQPHRTFYADPSQVVGRAVFHQMQTFDPFDPLIFQGERPLLAAEDDRLITLPAPLNSSQILIVGDRVDLLSDATNMQSPLVEDVLLVDQNESQVILAASGWKYAVLTEFAPDHQKYGLRLHDDTYAPKWDNTLTDMTITANESVSSGQPFDLFLRLPVEEGRWLVNSPYTLDDLTFSFNGQMLQFWFKDLSISNVTEETRVKIRLSHSDAANLEYVLSLGASLSFVPDTNSPAPTAASDALVAPIVPTLSPALTGCPSGQAVCVTVPDDYYEITLPLPKYTIVGPVKAGDRVSVQMDVASIDNVLLVSVEETRLTFAGPAWKYRVLRAFSEAGEPSAYSLRLYDPNTGARLFMPDEPRTYKLVTSDELPQETFGLRIEMPEVAIPDLAMMMTSYLFEGVDSTMENGTLYFVFPHVEMVTPNVKGYVIRMRNIEVAALEYLLSLDAEITLLMDAADSSAIAPAVLLDQGHVAIALPLSEPLPEGEIFDVLLSLPASQGDVLEGVPDPLEEIFYHPHDDVLDFWLVEVDPLAVTTMIPGDSASVVATVQVTRNDAVTLAHLLKSGAQVQFMPAGSSRILTERGHVVISLIASDDMPDTQRMDLVFSVPTSHGDVISGQPAPMIEMFVRSNGNKMEYWLPDAEPLDANSLTALGIEPQSDVITLQVKPSDAAVMTYLIENGAELRFLPENSTESLPPTDPIIVSLSFTGTLLDADQVDVIVSVPTSEFPALEESLQEIGFTMEALQIQHSDESVEFLFTNLDVIEIVSETQHVLVDVRGRGNEALMYLVTKGVNVRSVSASPPTVEPGYTRLGLPAPATMPDSNEVDIKFSLTDTKMSLLDDFPYEFDQVFSFDNAGVLEFWLNDVRPFKHVHAPEGTYASEYVVWVDVPIPDAANLQHLIEQGATVSILPNSPAPYSRDLQRVPVSLTVTTPDLLPDIDQVEIIASLTSASSSFEEIKALVSPDRIKDGRIELLHLTDVTLVSTQPAEADGHTLVTVEVVPYSARQLDYLVEIGAEFTFVPASEP